MELKITRDVTDESRSRSNVQNYVELFKDRYERLRELISGRSDSKQIPLNRIGEHEGEDVFLIGLVRGLRRCSCSSLCGGLCATLALVVLHTPFYFFYDQK